MPCRSCEGASTEAVVHHSAIRKVYHTRDTVPCLVTVPCGRQCRGMPWGAPGRGIEMFSFFHLFRFSGFFHFWFSWCTQVRGIEMFSVGSYKIGCILLAGLFFYDIFWVFGPCCLRCPPARLRRLTRLAADTTEALASLSGA